MKSLQNSSDVRQSQEATEGGGGRSNRVSIPDQKTPWYLLSLDYADGFVHYVKTDDDRIMRVVCGGAVDSGGMDADNCPVCEQVLRAYKEGKRLRGLDEDKAKKLGEEFKQIGNQRRGKYEAHFIAIRGVRRKYPGKKEWVADFELPEEDEEKEENPVAVGVLSLSNQQFQRLTSTIDDSNFPFISGGEDLGNRILWSHKEKKSGNFKEVIWTPDPHQSDPPEVPEEMTSELKIGEDFEVDMERLKTAAGLVASEAFGESDEEDEEDEASAGVSELSDEELDDEDDDDEDEDTDEDDFKDDLPDVEEDEEDEAVAEAKQKKRPDSVSKKKKRNRSASL